MIKKIMKHDFLALRKPLGITLAVAVVTSLIITGIDLIMPAIASNRVMIPTATTFTVLGFITVVAVPVVYWVFVVIHYYRSMYGKTGYFTMSIPAEAHQIFWAKTLLNSVVLIVSHLVMLGCFVLLSAGIVNLIAPFTDDDWGLSGDSWNTIWQTILLVALFLIFTSITGAIGLQFVITTGNHAPFLDRFGRIGGPVLVAVLTYVALQIFNAIMIIPPGQILFFAPNAPIVSFDWGGGLLNLFSIGSHSSDANLAISIWTIIGSILATIVMGCFTADFIKKGTSLR